MKKALLITWFNGENYGTVLQAYCLKEIIENPSITDFNNYALNFHIKVDILNYEEKSLITKKISNLFCSSPGEMIKKIKMKFILLVLKSNMEKRANKIDNFRKKSFSFFPKDKIDDVNKIIIDNYDYYIVGSDQIWNPTFLDETYLLGWCKNGLKLSYAPSICVNKISETQLMKYIPLNEFKYLSVRENSDAVNDLSNLLHKKIEIVVDPVILYGRAALLKKCTKKNGQNYCLTYLLGNDINSRKFSINFASSNNLDIKSLIAINHQNVEKDFILKKFAVWNIDPNELINVIYNSTIVITDSFHILVLSILLHKNFIILQRENINSEQNNRIIKILKLLNIENKFNMKSDTISDYAITENHWKKIDEKINEIRKSSYEYLIKGLNNEQ